MEANRAVNRRTPSTAAAFGGSRAAPASAHAAAAAASRLGGFGAAGRALGAAEAGTVQQTLYGCEQQQQLRWRQQLQQSRPNTAPAEPLASTEGWLTAAGHTPSAVIRTNSTSSSWQQYSQEQHGMQYSQRPYLQQHSRLLEVPAPWDSSHTTLPDRLGSGFSHQGPSTSGVNATAVAAASAASRHGFLSGQHRPDGLALVGSKIRVWWPLDREWYSATVQVSCQRE